MEVHWELNVFIIGPTRRLALACLGIAWPPCWFWTVLPDWGLSWHDALWLYEKRIFKSTNKRFPRMKGIKKIPNQQIILEDFANWKGGAGKDPNPPGKTPVYQETVRNLLWGPWETWRSLGKKHLLLGRPSPPGLPDAKALCSYATTTLNDQSSFFSEFSKQTAPLSRATFLPQLCLQRCSGTSTSQFRSPLCDLLRKIFKRFWYPSKSRWLNWICRGGLGEALYNIHIYGSNSQPWFSISDIQNWELTFLNFEPQYWTNNYRIDFFSISDFINWELRNWELLNFKVPNLNIEENLKIEVGKPPKLEFTNFNIEAKPQYWSLATSKLSISHPNRKPQNYQFLNFSLPHT